MDAVRLQAEVLRHRGRVKILGAVVGLLVALLRALDVRLEQVRLPEGAAKTRLLRARNRAQGALSLRAALRILGLSPSRYPGGAGASGSANSMTNQAVRGRLRRD